MCANPHKNDGGLLSCIGFSAIKTMAYAHTKHQPNFSAAPAIMIWNSVMK